MFDNIGGKIKGVASIVTTLGIICSCLLGFFQFFLGPAGILTGLLTAGIGSLVSWLGSLTLYGFGQLIENTDELRKAFCKKEKEKQEAPLYSEPQEKKKLTDLPPSVGLCSVCEKDNVLVKWVYLKDGPTLRVCKICSDCQNKHHDKISKE